MKIFSKFYKLIRVLFFQLIYKKINKVISANDEKNITEKVVTYDNFFKYKAYKISKGRLYSNSTHDTAYIIDKYLIKEMSFQYRYKKNKIKNANISENIILHKGTPSIKKRFKGSVFSLLVGGAAKKNYWHWLFDVLPKIAILEKSNFTPKPDYYIAPSLSKNFQTDSLKLLGISKSKLLNGEKFKHVICDNLLTVDHPSVFKNDPSKGVLNMPYWIIKWLRKKFIKKNYPHLKTPKKIFIDREGDSILENRKIVNNSHVKIFLKQQGFKSLVLSNYSFAKQIKIFSNAQFIVGLHGGGFANIIFSKPGTKILEIQAKQNGHAIFNLAKKCKLNYKRLIEKNISGKLKFQNSHVNVNLMKLKKIILSYN